MSRCVCTHIRALHVDGVCAAKLNPCGCHVFQDDDGTDPVGGPIPNDPYQGFYLGKRYSA